MAFDKDLYWARRNAGLHGDGRPKGNKTVYSNFEVEAMEYHKRVKELYLKGEITEDEARAELLDAGKAAADNLANTGAPEVVVAVIEQLVIHGSYEAIQAHAKLQKEKAAKSEKTKKPKQ